MAQITKNYLPRPKLVVFSLVIVAIYAVMAIAGTWTPRLGLDLRGGTTVTLTAREAEGSGPQAPAPTSSTSDSDPSVSPGGDPPAQPSPGPGDEKLEQNWAEAMDQAVGIIRERVDSLGVGETSVQQAGISQIEIQAPNINPTELVELVGQTAKLTFRTVYTYDYSYVAPPTVAPSTTPSTTPGPDASLEPGATPSDGTV
ncbi:MAG: hypothetical protein LBH11_06525, partial [Propionibacteriaceae bacterium]|nr:hypothetical protein [Propionibacteriaceae bacterium]